MSVLAGSHYTLPWLRVCSLYTTLLTLTIICVALIVRNRRKKRFKNSSLQSSLQSISSRTKSVRKSETQLLYTAIKQSTLSWKNFPTEYTASNPDNTQSLNDLEKHRCKHLHKSKPEEARLDNYNVTDDEISMKIDDLDQEYLKSNIKCDQNIKSNENLEKTEIVQPNLKCSKNERKPDDSEENCTDKAIELEKNFDNSTSSSSNKEAFLGDGEINRVKLNCSDNNVLFSAKSLCNNVPENISESFLKDSEVAHLSENNIIVVDTYITDSGVVFSFNVNKKNHIPVVQSNIIQEQESKNVPLKEVDKLNKLQEIAVTESLDNVITEIKSTEKKSTVSKEDAAIKVNYVNVVDKNSKICSNSIQTECNDRSVDISASQDFRKKISLEKFNEYSINKCTLNSNTPDLSNKSQDSQRKTTVYEDEAGNISIIQSLYTEMIHDSNPIPLEKKTYIYETETGTISLTQIKPSSRPLIENNTLTKSGLIETTVLNTNKTNTVLSDDKKTKTQIINDKIKNSDNTKKTFRGISTSIFSEKLGRKTTPVTESECNTQDDNEFERNENVSAKISSDSFTTKREDKQIQKQILTSLEKVKNLSNQFEHVAEKDRPDIVSKQNNTAMTKFLLEGLTSAVKNYNHEFKGLLKPTVLSKSTKIFESGDSNPFLKVNNPKYSKYLSETIIVDHKENRNPNCTSCKSKTNLKEKNINLSELDIYKTDTLAALKKSSDIENKPADQNNNLDKLVKDTQENLNQLISYLRQVYLVQNKKCILHPIPEDNVPEKDLSENIKRKPLKAEDKTNCHDLIVYQTATDTYVNRAKKESSNNENIIDTDFVSVRHRLPIPSSKNDSHDDDIHKVLAGSNVEIIEVGCSSSYSPVSDCYPIGKQAEIRTKDNSYSSVMNTDTDTKSNKNSILDDLLYMGERSELNTLDNNDESNFKRDHEIESNDSLFYITRDSSQAASSEVASEAKGECMQLSIVPQTVIQKKFHTTNRKPDLPPESYHDSARLKRNRHFEKVVSCSAEDCTDQTQNYRKDNRRELLEMLSFASKGNNNSYMTPERLSDSPTGRYTVTSHTNSDRLTTSLGISRCSTLGSMSTVNNDLEADIIPDRTSPNTPHNVSGCQCDKASQYISNSETESSPDRTPQRDKVIKTLRFEDNIEKYDIDAFVDYSTTNDSHVLSNPLIKIFGETSHVDESINKKCHVIPSYLKDVSDGLKALMLDLTKPMVADVIPFDSRVSRNQAPHRESSNISSEVQANLYTSSQIDLEPSRPYTMVSRKIKSTRKPKLKSIIKPHYIDNSDVDNEGGPDYSSSDFSYNLESDLHIEQNDEQDKRRNFELFVPFDPTNPLNNVALPPINVDVHRYSPISRDSQNSKHVHGYAPISRDTLNSEHEYYYSSSYNDSQISENVQGHSAISIDSEPENNYSPSNKDSQISKHVHGYSPISRDNQNSEHERKYSSSSKRIKKSVNLQGHASISRVTKNSEHVNRNSPISRNSQNYERAHGHSPMYKNTHNSEHVPTSKDTHNSDNSDDYPEHYDVYNDNGTVTQYSIDNIEPNRESDTMSDTENDKQIMTIKISGVTVHEPSKHEEINTAISMQDNKLLLENSSSLTLVEASSTHETNKQIDCTKRTKKRKMFRRKSRKYTLPHIFNVII